MINLRFSGQYYDAESKLHYNWNRYYDPQLGRYISSDPIGLTGGLNTFGYVGQSPLRFIDPKGLFWEDVAPEAYAEVGQFMDWAFNHSINDCVGLSNLMRAPDFVNFQVDFYVGSVWGTFSRDGNSFVGGGLNKQIPNPLSVGGSVSTGWINQATVSPGDTNNFVAGYAGGGTVSYVGVGGGTVISSSGATATTLGFGAGRTIGNTNNIGSVSGGVTYDQGYSGVAW